MIDAVLSSSISTEPLVKDGGTRISRRVFSDSAIHALEMERIFSRSWLFLGHESELPSPGNYVVRPMGGDQVIVWRGADKAIRGFLNVCPHKGAQLCRADAGSARAIACPYHAWTFDATGALRTTSYDQHYGGEDFSQLGLTQVAKLETYRGLIFANLDPDAVTLDEHLGDLKWYLDILFARTPGGMSVLSPPQRWVVETNWKIPAINFLDSQHALRTHKGPLSLGGEAAPSLAVIADLVDTVPLVCFPQGHGVVIGASIPGMPEFFGRQPELPALYKEALPPAQLDQFRQAPPSVGTIFPNASWVENVMALPVATDKLPSTFLSLRNWQPIGANKVEIWSWYFAEVEASAHWRSEMHRTALQTFGMGGIFEEDDSEVWASINRAIQGPVASRGYMNFGAGSSATPLSDFQGPGTVYPSQLTDHAQLGYFRRWAEMMGSAVLGDKAL